MSATLPHSIAGPAPQDGPDAPPGAAPDAQLPPPRRDLVPMLLVPAVALAVLPFVSLPAWITLTVAGLAMGMMIFIMASGLTLVFGLMGVLNFGHGAFVTVGAYVATLVLLPMRGWMDAEALGPNLAALLLAVGLAMGVTFVLGWAFERIVIKPVYGFHLKQILVTMGGMIVSEQLVTVIWGPDQIALPLPATLRGAVFLGEAAVEKYRLLAVVVGLVVFGCLSVVLNRTRIGLLIRAGVENPEMVEALGYRIRRLFVAVFAAGSALAGMGGVLWGLYKGTLTPDIGGHLLVLVFIVVIIGGLGSVSGCFIGSLLLALVANYAGYLAPKLALVSNLVLMVAILLWRPAGMITKGGH